MPKIDFLKWCIDNLATRYGWTASYCLEELYWEDFWEFVEMSANLNVEDKNDEFKFHFMLHADKKSKNKWEDLPIPFPDRETVKVKDKSGVDQLPPNLQRISYKPDEHGK